MDRHFRVVNDITLSDANFRPIGNDTFPFAGVFDGNNHTISNLRYESLLEYDAVGMIRATKLGSAIENVRLVSPHIEVMYGAGIGALAGYSEGDITNCHVEDCNMRSELMFYAYMGGLAGIHQGSKISRCSSTGVIHASGAAGGLVGWLQLYATVVQCHSSVDVFGTEQLGGLVGNVLVSNISDSYSSGTVTGSESRIGGLGGRVSAGEVSRCYTSGSVTGPAQTGAFVGEHSSGAYEGCFWDSTVNPALPGIGNLSDPNVVGLPTNEMQTGSTFTDAGWDFLGEAVNGADDHWRMCVDGVAYPRLSWQFGSDLLCPDGVEGSDYAFFAGHWGDTGCSASNDCDRTDLDFSGTVDWPDLKILCQHWLEGAGG
jgi:hypothetical protein